MIESEPRARSLRNMASASQPIPWSMWESLTNNEGINLQGQAAGHDWST